MRRSSWSRCSLLGRCTSTVQHEEVERAGVLFVSPKKDLLPYSFVLTQACSNNEAEYQAILLGLGMAVEMQIPQLHIYGDSALVIKQLTGEFEVKKPELEPFWRQARELLAQIPEASLHFVPRSENGPADALAGIAASLAQFDQLPSEIPICERWVIPPPREDGTEERANRKDRGILPYLSQSKRSSRLGAKSIANFLRHGTLPSTCENESRFGEQPQKSSSSLPIKGRGVTSPQRDTQWDLWGTPSRPKLHLQTKRLGYYWPSMLGGAIEMARTCKNCQLHADYIHQSAGTTSPDRRASWPFEAWGWTSLVPSLLSPTPTRQYILAATDYFSKWAKLLLTEK
ncbi:hypothetical protein H6P81_020410 [Aristolochia fimbriata]|uniref:RNase H type-1 domain-containing protein n=1 Tax=Aristolochia fimbriata TaxID=158543 RepID=A0AAV7DW71_ARIFI|nr:hypothetical protein H6P81_020410 [Aristolochia fimbriata]